MVLIDPHPPWAAAPCGADDNAAAGIAGSAGVARRRRKSRTSSGRSATGVGGDVRLSNASRQFSDGGGERTVKSASAVAQEALNAGGTLQTAEAREEGAVALRVS